MSYPASKIILFLASFLPVLTCYGMTCEEALADKHAQSIVDKYKEDYAQEKTDSTEWSASSLGYRNFESSENKEDYLKEMEEINEKFAASNAYDKIKASGDKKKFLLYQICQFVAYQSPLTTKMFLRSLPSPDEFWKDEAGQQAIKHFNVQLEANEIRRLYHRIQQLKGAADANSSPYFINLLNELGYSFDFRNPKLAAVRDFFETVRTMPAVPLAKQDAIGTQAELPPDAKAEPGKSGTRQLVIVNKRIQRAFQRYKDTQERLLKVNTGNRHRSKQQMKIAQDSLEEAAWAQITTLDQKLALVYMAQQLAASGFKPGADLRRVAYPKSNLPFTKAEACKLHIRAQELYGSESGPSALVILAENFNLDPATFQPVAGLPNQNSVDADHTKEKPTHVSPVSQGATVNVPVDRALSPEGAVKLFSVMNEKQRAKNLDSNRNPASLEHDILHVYLEAVSHSFGSWKADLTKVVRLVQELGFFHLGLEDFNPAMLQWLVQKTESQSLFRFLKSNKLLPQSLESVRDLPRGSRNAYAHLLPEITALYYADPEVKTGCYRVFRELDETM